MGLGGLGFREEASNYLDEKLISGFPVSREFVDELVTRDVLDPVRVEILLGSVKILAQVTEQNRDIVVWGAGSLEAKVLTVHGHLGVPIRAVVDINPLKWNKTVNGINVISPELAFIRFYRPYVVIANSYPREVYSSLRERGLSFHEHFSYYPLEIWDGQSLNEGE